MTKKEKPSGLAGGANQERATMKGGVAQMFLDVINLNWENMNMSLCRDWLTIFFWKVCDTFLLSDGMPVVDRKSDCSFLLLERFSP